MSRLVFPIPIVLGLITHADGHENPQTRPILHERQARCIVRDSEVHKVYRTMLIYLQRDVQEWDKLKIWIDEKMPLISPSIEIHRSKSVASLNVLESVPVCPSDS